MAILTEIPCLIFSWQHSPWTSLSLPNAIQAFPLTLPLWLSPLQSRAPEEPPSSLSWTSSEPLHQQPCSGSATEPRWAGAHLHHAVPEARTNQPKCFLLSQIFTEGCSVLAFPQCRIRSSERNFLEVMNPLKPLPSHHTELGPKAAWGVMHQDVFLRHQDTQPCKHGTLMQHLVGLVSISETVSVQWETRFIC